MQQYHFFRSDPENWVSANSDPILAQVFIYIYIRGVTIRFNNDSIRITIRGCRYDTRTILVHLERYDPKRFSDLKSIQ